MGRGTRARQFLALLGAARMFLCIIPIPLTRVVIDASFKVGSGAKAERDYHTLFGVKRTALKGEVTVEDEGVYLTVTGYNTQPLKNVYVKGQYSFTVDPASDIYVFSFDNTGGSVESLVKFILRENWFGPLAYGPWMLVGLPLFVVGLATVIIIGLTSPSPRSTITQTRKA